MLTVLRFDTRNVAALAVAFTVNLGSSLALSADLGRYETETLKTSADMVSWGGMGGVTVDSEGFIYQSNFGEYLWRIHPRSAEVTLLADGLLSASGNAALPGGDLLQAEFRANRILRVDRNGKLSVFSDEGLTGPVGLVAVTGRGVYAANCIGGDIVEIPFHGGPAVHFASHELFNCPNGITADHDGNLYVVNNQDTYVFKITLDGKASVLEHLPGVGHGHITFARNALYIAQLWNHKIVRLGLDGAYSNVAGSGRPGLADGFNSAATVIHPNGIAARGSVLYHNNIDGPMLVGERARLVIRKTYLPNPVRNIRSAFYEGGIEKMRAIYTAYRDLPDTDKFRLSQQASRAAAIPLQQGHYEAGLELLALNVSNNPAHVSALMNLADAHAQHGSRQHALEIYSRARKISPEDRHLLKRIEDLKLSISD